MKRSELEPVKGGPAYCRRCRRGPRLLYRVTGHGGILVGKWCKACLDDLDSGAKIKGPPPHP